jgi:hypothetical protein
MATAGLSLDAILSRKYSASSTVPAGITGKIYPGSFDFEIEKKRTITATQIIRNPPR